MYSSQTDPLRQRLRRISVFAVVASLISALAVVAARPAHAAASPVATPRAGSSAPSTPTRAVPQAPDAATVLPNRAAAPVAIYTVSSAVYTFLHSGLGLALGGSAKLSGTKSGTTITLTAGKPTSVGLPSGVAAPAFGTAKIVIDTKTNVLTATSSARTPSPATLSVQIAHANTSTLPAQDLTASLSMTATVLGTPVMLTGPLTNSGGRPVLALTGALSAADVVKSGVITIASGAAITLSTAGGVQVNGAAATVGAGASAAAVTVSGTVTNATSWKLQVTRPVTNNTWKPFPGLSETPKFTGNVTDTAGRITFDLISKVAVAWTPVAGTTQSATKVEYANITPPSGSPSLAVGDAWVDLTGSIDLPAGTNRSIATAGTIIVNAATAHATLSGAQQGTVQLGTTPSVTLGGAAVAGTFVAGSTSSAAPVTGTSTVTVGSSAPVTATLTLTTRGVLVVDFKTDLAPFGLGAAGSFGEILYASAPIAAYTVPSTGKTISLQAGFSSSSGQPANSGTTYTLSANADQFLNSLGLSLGSGTITGTPSGSVLTVTEGAPTLPITLPAGDPSVTFGKTTLVIDTATDTVTATAATTAGSGTAASISITIRHASASTLTSADLTATAHISSLELFGAAVDLDGSISYANGNAAVTLSGTITRDLVVAPGLLTVHAGTVVSLSNSGLHVDGSADLGADPAKITVGFGGTISGLQNWNLTVSTANGAPTFQPIDGLTITPKFTGTITDNAGAIGFDISGDDLVSWQPGSSVTVAVKHVEISNQSPPGALSCPSAIKDGQLWIDASGSLTYAPSSSDVNVTASVEGCIAPTAKAFTLTTSAIGTLFQGAGFQIGNAVLTVNGDLAAGKISVKASAQIVITTSGNATPLTVGLSFASDGTFVAGVAVPDLSSIGLSGTSGYLFVATKDIRNFDPADLGIHNADGSAITPFDLTAGVTATLAFKLSDNYVKALQDLNIPLNGATVQLVATLSKTGFSVKIEVNFGAADQGVTLITTSQGIKIVLDTIYIDFDLSETSTTLSLGATAYLHIPPVVPGGDPSNVEVAVTGSINVDTLTFSVGVSLSGVCNAGDCAWHNAFGIPGLSVDSLSGTIGVDFETAIPTPTISLKVYNLVLPDAWASAIGMVPGTTITLALDLNLSQPAVDIEIDPGAGSTVALTPLKIFTSDNNVVNQLQIGKADLLFAPLGGTEADGTVLTPGANLVFDATIAGVGVHIGASVDLSPTNPSIHADVTVGGFSIGPVTLQSPMLHLAIAPLAADVSFSGGFSDTTTGIKFGASIDLGVSTSLLNAAVSLQIKAGLPQYLLVDGSLSGSVRLDSGGLDISASGSLYLSIAGFYLSAISVSYSGNASTIWRDLNNDFAAVAAAFVSAYNWSVAQINDVLNSLGFNLTQIAQAISSAFNQGATWVLEQLQTAGVAIDSAVQAVIDGINATDKQVADALQALGWDFNNIANELKDKFNEGSAALYNVLVSIGDYGQAVLNSLSTLFNNGSYNLWVGDAPDVLDVNGASQDAGGRPHPVHLERRHQPGLVRPADRQRIRRAGQPKQRTVPGQRRLDRAVQPGAGALQRRGQPAVVPERVRRRWQPQRAATCAHQPVQRVGGRRYRRILLARRDSRAVLRQRREQPEVDVPACSLTPPVCRHGSRSTAARNEPSMWKGVDVCSCTMRHSSSYRRSPSVDRYQRVNGCGASGGAPMLSRLVHRARLPSTVICRSRTSDQTLPPFPSSQVCICATSVALCGGCTSGGARLKTRAPGAYERQYVAASPVRRAVTRSSIRSRMAVSSSMSYSLVVGVRVGRLTTVSRLGRLSRHSGDTMSTTVWRTGREVLDHGEEQSDLARALGHPDRRGEGAVRPRPLRLDRCAVRLRAAHHVAGPGTDRSCQTRERARRRNHRDRWPVRRS